MSKHNYSQYSNKNNKPKQPQKSAEVKMEFDEPVVTEASVTPMVETVDTVVLPKSVSGVVVNCSKLNVRAEPNTDSAIVCVLEAMSEIEIDVNKSNNEWFKICTAIGVEGYCMRKFVDARL